MLERVPDTYDKSEGGILWDTLAPVAPEITRLAEAGLPECSTAGLLTRRPGDDLDAAVEGSRC